MAGLEAEDWGPIGSRGFARFAEDAALLSLNDQPKIHFSDYQDPPPGLRPRVFPLATLSALALQLNRE
jgi:hypothetical protein